MFGGAYFGSTYFGGIAVGSIAVGPLPVPGVVNHGGSVFVEQGTLSFDDASIGFDDTLCFDEVCVQDRTVTGGRGETSSSAAGWLRTRGPWLGNRPFTQKTSAHKAEPQRRREGPMLVGGRLVREH